MRTSVCAPLLILLLNSAGLFALESLDRSTRVTAFYFHGTVRCETCLSIEKLARAAVEEQFRVEIASKRLSFASVDYDLPTNRHFLAQFNLPHPSLVLVEQPPGQSNRWKLLPRTWDLAHEPGKLKSYVAGEVKSFIAAGRSSTQGNDATRGR